MDAPIKIFADFNNADTKGRVRLNTVGTLKDIVENNINLESGLLILLDDDDGLVTTGIVEFSEQEKMWVAKIDWEEFKKQNNNFYLHPMFSTQ